MTRQVDSARDTDDEHASRRREHDASHTIKGIGVPIRRERAPQKTGGVRPLRGREREPSAIGAVGLHLDARNASPCGSGVCVHPGFES